MTAAATLARRIEDRLSGFLSAIPAHGLAASVAPLAADHAPDPGEAVFVAGAVAARRREFAAGRSCARRALTRLGCPPRPVPMGALREPVWPPGFAGSISHGKILAVAVACPDPTGGTRLGIDLIDRIDPADYLTVFPSIAHPADATCDGFAAARLFSAKEAAVKIISPAIGGFVEMRHLRASPTADGFAVAFHDRGMTIPVRVLELENVLISVAIHARFPASAKLGA